MKKYETDSTVVPATAGPLGERRPALAGHFCNAPTNYCICRVNVPVSGDHLPRGATFAPNRRWPLVAGTNVLENDDEDWPTKIWRWYLKVRKKYGI